MGLVVDDGVESESTGDRPADVRWLRAPRAGATQQVVREVCVAKLNYYEIGWYLDEALCPCDVHLVRWIEKEGIKGKAIFHFGTGEHHTVGIRCHELGSDNAVLGITASPREHEFYEKLIIERPEIGRTYKVLFGDIYQLDARLLPELDIAALFHIGEFRTDKNDAYGALTDEEMVRLIVGRLKGPKLLLLYTGSYAFDVADRIAAKLVEEGVLEPAGSFESLKVFRRRT